MTDHPDVLVNGHVTLPGCYIDGHYGQYVPDMLAELAEGFGWPHKETLKDPRVCRYIAETDTDQEDRLDAWSAFYDASDEILEWLNEHTDPAYQWGWSDGEIFLMSNEWWREEA